MPRTAARVGTAADVEIPALFAFHFISFAAARATRSEKSPSEKFHPQSSVLTKKLLEATLLT